MPFFSLFYRDKLESKDQKIFNRAVFEELDNLSAIISGWASQQHNVDGSHNVRPFGIDFVPVGGMIYWPITTAPSGWLTCNGAAISRASYPLLFTRIGISAGAGDGSTTFNIPNVANHIILAI